MQHRGIEVSFATSTWNPKRTTEAVNDAVDVIDLAHITDPQSLEGVRRVVVDADEWAMYIYCTKSPSRTQMDLWLGIWESKLNRIMHWYDMSQPEITTQMGTYEEVYCRKLESMVEILYDVLHGTFLKEHARTVFDLRFLISGRNHEALDKITNAIAFWEDQQNAGKAYEAGLPD